MGDIGLEQPTFLPEKAGAGETGGAHDFPGDPGVEADPALALVVRRWPTLTPGQRLAILEIATATTLEAVPLPVASGVSCDGTSPRSGKTKFRRHK